jgi:hypothetical protein
MVVLARGDLCNDCETRTVGIASPDARIARRDDGPSERRCDPHLRRKAVPIESAAIIHKARDFAEYFAVGGSDCRRASEQRGYERRKAL